jgi:hypothetical protein
MAAPLFSPKSFPEQAYSVSIKHENVLLLLAAFQPLLMLAYLFHSSMLLLQAKHMAL